jgi:hypothetical protein
MVVNDLPDSTWDHLRLPAAKITKKQKDYHEIVAN